MAAAGESFRQALALDEEDPLSHARLGLTLLKQQRYAEARASLRRAAALDSSLHEAAYGLGLAAARTGDLAGAVFLLCRGRPAQSHQRLSAVKPRGGIREIGQIRRGCPRYARAVELDPANKRAHSTSATHYQQLGHLQKSRVHREKARQLAHEVP